LIVLSSSLTLVFSEYLKTILIKGKAIYESYIIHQMFPAPLLIIGLTEPNQSTFSLNLENENFIQFYSW